MSLRVNNLTGFGANRVQESTVMDELSNMTIDSSGWDGYTIKIKTDSATMTAPSFAISNMRFTFKGGISEGCKIAKCYVGHQAASGEEYDADSFTQITFNAGDAFGVATALDTISSDWINFVWDKSKNLIFSAYFDDATKDNIVIAAGLGNYFYKTGDEASLVDASGYTSSGGNLGLIGKIEAMR